MNNLKTIAAILLGATIAVSCIKEDLSDCPQTNLTLNLHYLGDTKDPDMFGRMIEDVTLFVFDASGQEVSSRALTNGEIASQEVGLTLPSGQTYQIICWANALDKTMITSGSHLSAFLINHPNYGKAGAAIPSNDHLYMGETSVAVPSTGVATGAVYFRGAHNNLEIYIDNFGRKDTPSTYPVVEVANLMPQYDLQMNAKQPADETYHPATTLDSGHGLLAAKLQTLLFDDDNPVIITIKDPSTGAVKFTFDLKKYMADKSISIDGKNERTISVQVTFTDIGVKITIPDWEITDIRP